MSSLFVFSHPKENTLPMFGNKTPNSVPKPPAIEPATQYINPEPGAVQDFAAQHSGVCSVKAGV